VHTVSGVQRGAPGLRDVALSLPTVVDVDGAVDVIPVKLDDAEREGLDRSAGVLRKASDSLRA
jgi:L-lactate dehydrogenase